jgi:hypothetical protein
MQHQVYEPAQHGGGGYGQARMGATIQHSVAAGKSAAQEQAPGAPPRAEWTLPRLDRSGDDCVHRDRCQARLIDALLEHIEPRPDVRIAHGEWL